MLGDLIQSTFVPILPSDADDSAPVQPPRWLRVLLAALADHDDDDDGQGDEDEKKGQVRGKEGKGDQFFGKLILGSSC